MYSNQYKTQEMCAMNVSQAIAAQVWDAIQDKHPV